MNYYYILIKTIIQGNEFGITSINTETSDLENSYGMVCMLMDQEIEGIKNNYIEGYIHGMSLEDCNDDIFWNMNDEDMVFSFNKDLGDRNFINIKIEIKEYGI